MDENQVLQMYMQQPMKPWLDGAAWDCYRTFDSLLYKKVVSKFV